MVTSDLGACEWFVWDLRRSGLIDRGQLDHVVGEFLKRNPRAEPPALAEYLVAQGILSAFQAERILQGKTQGLVLGPYVLLDTIGSGSMGQVYKANSKTDNQLYAVKVLPRRSMWNVRLARRQVRAFGQFNHAAVVPFVDVGTSGGLHYLVWPLVEGETLENLVQRVGKLTPDQTAMVGLHVAQGLNIGHQNGLFHGLLKPSNVMVGGDGQSRILDFGIGSLLVENEGESLVDTMSASNTLTSGLDCASPESIMEPTNRTPAGDQYSLGCTLYYCLAGHFPFPEGSAVEKMMAHQFKQPTPLAELCPDAPAKLIEIIERLMQKAPESRYAGADEVVDVLQPFVRDVVALPTRPVHKPGSSAGTKPAVAAASAQRYSPPTMANFSVGEGSSSHSGGGTSLSGSASGTSAPSTGRPPLPTRSTVQQAPPAPQVPTQPQPTPAAQNQTAQQSQPASPAHAPGWAVGQGPGGWVPEDGDKKQQFGQVGLIILTVAVTATVFYLGRMWFGG